MNFFWLLNLLGNFAISFDNLWNFAISFDNLWNFAISGCCQDIRVSRPRPCAMAHVVLGSGVPLHPGVPEQPGMGHPGLPTFSRKAFLLIYLLIRPGTAILWQKTDIRTSAVVFDQKRVCFGLGRLVAVSGRGLASFLAWCATYKLAWVSSNVPKRFKTFQTSTRVTRLGPPAFWSDNLKRGVLFCLAKRTVARRTIWGLICPRI